MSLCESCECLLSAVAGKYIGGSTLCLCVVWSPDEKHSQQSKHPVLQDHPRQICPCVVFHRATSHSLLSTPT